MTSRRLVNQVQRLLRGAKVGHAGTLDPLADGVMLLCVGPATRLIPYLQRMTKYYRATFLLGCESATEDVEGEIVELKDPHRPTDGEIREAAGLLVGEIMQQPPVYSAIKVGGRRSYKRARAGETFELEPRRVTVHELQLVEYNYPRFVLDVRCGAGTYVRSLGRDLARSLRTGAVMEQLTRRAVGSFSLAEAVDPSQLTNDNLSEAIQSPRRALETLPTIELSSEEQRLVGNGREIHRTLETTSEELVAIDSQGRLLSILVSREPGVWRPSRNFPVSVDPT